METYKAGDLVRISHHQYMAARKNALEFSVYRERLAGEPGFFYAIKFHSIASDSVGMILKQRDNDEAWLVMFDDVIVIIPDDTREWGMDGKWLEQVNV
jgi:hypothetical protein